MELHELEFAFTEMMDAWSRRELTDAALIQGGEGLVEKLTALNSPDADVMAYRVRLGILPARNLTDQAGHFAEVKDLLALHESDPARFPAHPQAAPGSVELVDAQGRQLHNVLLEQVRFLTNLPYNADISRKTVFEGLELAQRYAADEDEKLHMLISCHQSMDAPEKVLDKLDQFLTNAPEDDLHTWLHRHDSAIMAYMETGDLARAEALLDKLTQVGAGIGYLPSVVYAQSLAYMSQFSDLNALVSRARHVLQVSVGRDGLHLGPILQVARFLMNGGLGEQALALVEQTEGIIEDPTSHVRELALFCRAATRHGFGQRELGRFGSPRWQRELRVDPQQVTCSALYEKFMVPARQEAEKFDRRNGTNHRMSELESDYEVPELESWYFRGTVVDSLTGVVNLPAYPDLGFEVDPELLSVINYLFELSDETAQLPSYIAESEDLPSLLSDMHSEEQFRGEEAAVKLEQIANDPATDKQVRTFIELELLNGATRYNRPVHATAVRALPVLAGVSPDAAVGLSINLAEGLQFRGEKDSGLTHACLSYAMGLMGSGFGNYRMSDGLFEAAFNSRRFLDAKVANDHTIRSVAADPSVAKDPDRARIRLFRQSHSALIQMYNYREAADRLHEAAYLAYGLGDYDTETFLLGLIVEAYCDAEEYNLAARYNDSINLDTPGLSLRSIFMGRAAGVRMASALIDELFDEQWPEKFKQLQESAEEWSATGDEEFHTLMARLVLDVAPKLEERGAWTLVREFTSWSAKFTQGARDTFYVRVVMCSQASAFAQSGMHREASLILESLLQRTQAAGDTLSARYALEQLEDYVHHYKDPAYLEVWEEITAG
ncbi:hypothetical protein [Corynebacterium cystitidis]|uniref:Uncharacterized protein n=1 Tax=Corynebacterium cystitidis DSM 20524 TaxID=1121357 RepID=A0A1H9RCW1_9CORY|nr:hypothetical protein [Corynebacterium cystitidis]WJY81472.1 hypothetical protein CCYS_02495 [Corynebacterium cystitidis DSM 20524]SER70761.1 hypothetical protein SAMN05661109_00858 [Corynebacterium cystitidis DSM 20524]SNV87184.1 Uncharacterised protein [Corynebacterium cystitidis]